MNEWSAALVRADGTILLVGDVHSEEKHSHDAMWHAARDQREWGKGPGRCVLVRREVRHSPWEITEVSG